MSLSARRAWIEIGKCYLSRKYSPGSLSARRAWIEMRTVKAGTVARVVALRKESVDRNMPDNSDFIVLQRSLSARRAWIEIPY